MCFICLHVCAQPASQPCCINKVESVVCTVFTLCWHQVLPLTEVSNYFKSWQWCHCPPCALLLLSLYFTWISVVWKTKCWTFVCFFFAGSRRLWSSRCVVFLELFNKILSFEVFWLLWTLEIDSFVAETESSGGLGLSPRSEAASVLPDCNENNK